MKLASSVVVRYLLACSVAVSVSAVVNWRLHKHYWLGTIRRVQTVDINMLSHMLPTKLSYALAKGEVEELQRTLDSNYGLFGIVVTTCKTEEVECPEQEFYYSTNSSFEWKKQLSPITLLDSPYSTLRSPIPLYAEGQYDNPRDETWELTEPKNQGEIIGRVYYIRGVPPTFWQDYWDWIQKLPVSLLSDSGADKYYALSTILFLLTGVTVNTVLESILLKSRVSQQESKKRTERAQGELYNIRRTLQDNILKNNQLEQQIQQNIRDIAYYREREENLQTVLAEVPNQTNQQDQSERIIQTLREQHQVSEQREKETRRRVQELQQTLNRINSQRQDEQRQLASLEKQLNEAKEKANQNSQYKDDFDKLLQEVAKRPYNSFEKSVFNILNNSKYVQKQQWKVIGQIDVSRNKLNSQFVDFIVICPTCIFVLEAKDYRGLIKAEGDLERSKWTSTNKNTGSSVVINASWANNPYGQVAKYVHSVLETTSRKRKTKGLWIYGVVVFPSQSDISELDQKIKKRYLVTKLDSLVEDIRRFEAGTKSSYVLNRRRILSLREIEDIILGIR